MNLAHPGFDSAADGEASLWAARLDGSSLSAADRSALDAWLAENPSHRALLSQYCQFSADLEQQLPALAEAGLLEMPSDKRSSRRFARIAGFTGAVLAAAAGITALVWSAHHTNQFQTIATPFAHRQSVTLPDGTKVQLNAQTSIALENTSMERRVRMADGEAFFEVTKDASRPFIVETPAGSVRVTGTKFNVHTEAGSPFEVTVVEGSVQVRPGELSSPAASAPVSLTAGDRLSADANGVAVQNLTRSALEDTLAWRQGQVVFDRTPLRAALARFARYHGRGITTTPEAGDLRIGGRFSLDDPEGFFAALEEILPVRVTRDLSGTTRVGLRSAP